MRKKIILIAASISLMVVLMFYNIQIKSEIVDNSNFTLSYCIRNATAEAECQGGYGNMADGFCYDNCYISGQVGIACYVGDCFCEDLPCTYGYCQ